VEENQGVTSGRIKNASSNRAFDCGDTALLVKGISTFWTHTPNYFGSALTIAATH